MNSALLAKIDVPLSVPVTVAASDGKAAERSSITIRRPKVRHAKRLAVILGSDLLDALLDGADTSLAIKADTDGRKLVADVLRKLFDEDRLDGLTDVIADLAGEDRATIDDIDLVDLPAVAMAFARFFPKLQSAMDGLSRPISPPSGATTPAT
ncbi:hypothetical protein [Shinella sp.]|uniref:hypothetical protein n=1 Tax=Shinella sp. TaxID=1870904 RepID=UPI0039E52BE6